MRSPHQAQVTCWFSTHTSVVHGQRSRVGTSPQLQWENPQSGIMQARARIATRRGRRARCCANRALLREPRGKGVFRCGDRGCRFAGAVGSALNGRLFARRRSLGRVSAYRPEQKVLPRRGRNRCGSGVSTATL
jgi:hypothetical protein